MAINYHFRLIIKQIAAAYAGFLNAFTVKIHFHQKE